MKKRILLPMLTLLALPLCGASKYVTRPMSEKIAEKDLTFLVTFDGKGVNADFAKGDKFSTTMKNEGLMLRGLIGFDDRSAFKPESGEALRFNVADNADPQNGTLIMWVNALDYNPFEGATDGKGRGNIALAHLVFDNGGRTIQYQLYEYKENVYFDWTSSVPPHGHGQGGRVYMPRKNIKKGQWHQIACTWNGKRLAIYLNGNLMKEEALPGKAAKVADIKAVNNAESFIGIKSPFLGDNHAWGVGVDDFAIYKRALSPLEIRNQYLKLLKEKGDAKIEAYAITLNGINIGRNDKIDRLEAEFDFSSLNAEQQKLLDAGKLQMSYEMKAPDGKVQKGSFTFKNIIETRIFNGINQAGKYTLTTKIGNDTVVKSVVRPDFSWVGNGYGDEDEVPALWKDFSLNGRTVKLWNRTYKFGAGPLPVEITAYGKKLFDKIPELLIDGKKPVWKAGKVRKEAKAVTFTGTGKLGKAVINYATRVEYDGMMLVDWTVSGEPTVSDMKFTWKMAPENHQFLMTPTVNEDKNPAVSWAYPEGGHGSMLWFVSEKKGGFAFSMVNDANWIYNKGEKVFFADKKTGDVTVRMITKKVKMPQDTPYRAIFIATPTRPLPAAQRGFRYNDSRGGGKSMTNAGGEGGFAGIFHHAPHPTDFEYKHKGGQPGRLGVYGGIALTALEPEAVYLRKYWEVPGAYSYNMPWHRPLGNGKYRVERYPSLSTCTSSVVNDFFLNSQHKLYNHKYSKMIEQVYYDLCGNGICRSKLHGCRYTDKFGREVNSYKILGERDLIRRTVAYAHKHGKTVMLHGQRSYFPMIHGLADYWFPGEQYNVLLRRNPFGYADEVSDDIYRSEFNKHVLGVGVLHLPALGQADQSFNSIPEYTEAMMAMLQLHDVETSESYTCVKVVQSVWDILNKYNIGSPETICRMYHEQKEVTSSRPEVRVTYYKTPGNQYILWIVNNTYRGRRTTIDLNGLIKNGNFKAIEEYKKKDIEVKNGKFQILVPARSFRVVCFPPKALYPVHDEMKLNWRSWRPNAKCDTEFIMTENEGVSNSSASKMISKSTGGGCFMNFYPIVPGKTYTFSVMAKSSVAGHRISLGIQARTNNYFAGASPVSKAVTSTGEWQKIELVFKVPTTGKWAKSNNAFVTLGAAGKDMEVIFDDFKVEEK